MVGISVDQILGRLWLVTLWSYVFVGAHFVATEIIFYFASKENILRKSAARVRILNKVLKSIWNLPTRAMDKLILKETRARIQRGFDIDSIPSRYIAARGAVKCKNRTLSFPTSLPNRPKCNRFVFITPRAARYLLQLIPIESLYWIGNLLLQRITSLILFVLSRKKIGRYINAIESARTLSRSNTLKKLWWENNFLL